MGQKFKALDIFDRKKCISSQYAAGRTNPFFDSPVERKSCAVRVEYLFSLVA